MSKIVRDPLYNYISIDSDRDKWLIDLLDCPEVQRLRRIHQVGVSSVTYPGADHNRLSHSLGVVHLMQKAIDRLEQVCKEEQVSRARPVLLAAALLHDVGHGPFSHLFEPCLGIQHEEWSVRIIRDESTNVFDVLKSNFDGTFPAMVASLVEEENYELPVWQKSLLSSQLDVDRLDYLRRDSLFSGAGCGHFDWYRILNTFEFHGSGADRDIVWTEKAKFAIEEYVFSRYYMYQNVYLHKTTRGIEKLLEAMWTHAQRLRGDGSDVALVPAIEAFWTTKDPSVAQYLAIEEFTVLEQIQRWADGKDTALADLATRFLNRDQFAMVEPPLKGDVLAPEDSEWEAALRELVEDAGYSPPELYCLRDTVKGKYNQPYFPEKESDEQSAKNAIRLVVPGESQPIEISRLLPRLQPLTMESDDRYRYYVPKDVREKADTLRDQWGSGSA